MLDVIYMLYEQTCTQFPSLVAEMLLLPFYHTAFQESGQCIKVPV